jgi:Fe-S-cluster-containing dehydrogenase component
MNHKPSRRQALTVCASILAGAVVTSASRPLKAAVQKEAASKSFPKGYDPHKHKWQMVIDVDRCIGCGLCADACKTENGVPREPTFFRTWVERYIILQPEPGSTDTRGETIVDSPNGGIDGFPPTKVPKEQILQSFFVPKLCNSCRHSPCTQACPVGAAFDAPDGVVLVDKEYCIGCGFCIQACPYGCRYFNKNTHTADKCTLCYHRITRGLKPACVEVCPTGARIFGDLMDPSPDNPIRKFAAKNKVQTLKPYLGTEPRLLYANLDKEVR